MHMHGEDPDTLVGSAKGIARARPRPYQLAAHPRPPSINKSLLVDGCGEIRIGSNVRIGPACKLITSVHEVTTDPLARSSAVPSYRPIVIGNGVWLGAGAVVLAGVTWQKAAS